MVRLIKLEAFLVLRERTIVLVSAGLLVLLLGTFYLSGALTARFLPPGYSSPLELIGQALMFAIIIPYLFMAFSLSRLYSLQLAAQMEQSFGRQGITDKLRAHPLLAMAIGGLAGAVNGLFQNTTDAQVSAAMNLEPVALSVVFGNTMTWTVAGIGLVYRFHVAWQFHRFTQQLDIDLFDVRALRPVALNGLADVLMVCGSLAITTLQALDATFRLDNFANALVVAVPALVILFLGPLYSTHKRIQRLKLAQLESIQSLIRNAPRNLKSDAMAELEVLLQRRERIIDAPTWPIDLSMLWRLFLYGVIPPIAWVAAALVEIYLESRITG